MAEMLVITPEVKRTVHDYDFVLRSNMVLPVTINPDAGDTIVFSDKVVLISLVSKPSTTDPDSVVPAEDITIFIDSLASVQHRIREITELTPEQRFAWNKTLQEIGRVKQ
jgi:hypothetical protein